MNYVGRLAPSPTGLLHLGHAATFIVAHDRARAAGGHLILRIDDLDPQRSKEHFIHAAKEDLTWLGLSWDEEVRQSERIPLYREAMEQLTASGLAYSCICSRKELQQATQAPHEETDDEPVYNGRCRPSPIHVHRTAGPGASHTSLIQADSNYRFHIPDGEAVDFVDQHCGEQRYVSGCIATADFGDFVVWRKDGLPSYQLACVVDDARMSITEVVRGRDLLKSAARQILLQRALNLRTPAYFHTDLLRDERGERLAKRHDALSLRALRQAGVSPSEIRARVHTHMHLSKGGGAPCKQRCASRPYA